MTIEKPAPLLHTPTDISAGDVARILAAVAELRAADAAEQAISDEICSAPNTTPMSATQRAKFDAASARYDAAKATLIAVAFDRWEGRAVTVSASADTSAARTPDLRAQTSANLAASQIERRSHD